MRAKGVGIVTGCREALLSPLNQCIIRELEMMGKVKVIGERFGLIVYEPVVVITHNDVREAVARCAPYTGHMLDELAAAFYATSVVGGRYPCP